MNDTFSPIPPRLRFPGLNSSAFEHPGDRKALEALRSTPGLDRLLKWLSDKGAERMLRIQYATDSLRVSPKQCSRLYDDLKEACAILDVPEPELYISQNPYPSATSFGMQCHTVVLTTSLVDLLSNSERLFIIGRELGHIKAEHMLYRTMATILADILKDASDMFAIPAAVVSHSIVYALSAWFRKSELTADRAGLLVAQDTSVCITALMKLVAGSHKLMDDLNPEEFVKQAEFLEDVEDDMMGLYYKLAILRMQAQPFPSVRAREMIEWSKTIQYRNLMDGVYPHSDPVAGQRTCKECGLLVTNITYKFCPDCGSELPGTK